MLEREIIQHRGFHNITRGGETVGFQVPVKLWGYRGSWLSEIRFEAVIVDGEVFGPDKVAWQIGGVEYTCEEMLGLGRVFWPRSEAARLLVRKPGGLAQGEHTVRVNFWRISSYNPPFIDEATGEWGRTDPALERKMLIV